MKDGLNLAQGVLVEFCSQFIELSAWFCTWDSSDVDIIDAPEA